MLIFVRNATRSLQASKSWLILAVALKDLRNGLIRTNKNLSSCVSLSKLDAATAGKLGRRLCAGRVFAVTII